MNTQTIEEILDLGTATVSFNKNTNLLYSTFTPAKVTVRETVENSDVSTGHEEFVKKQVQVAVAKFFSNMNEVELADREDYGINVDVVKCKKYDTGELKEAELKVTFGPLK